MNRASRRKDRGNVGRIWYRLRPSALRFKTRAFHSQQEKRAYADYLRRVQARAAMSLPV